MQSALRRIARLEKSMGNTEGLQIVVHAGPNETQIDEVLRERGFDRSDPKHQLVIFKTLHERKDGSIEPDHPKAKIVYVGPKSKRAA